MFQNKKERKLSLIRCGYSRISASDPQEARLMPNQKGVVLLLTAFLILFMSIFVIGFLEVATTETEIMRNHSLSNNALYIAEAGIEDAIYTLRQAGNHHWDEGFTDKVFPAGSSSSYTVTVDNGDYPTIVITSTGTVSGTFQRQVEAEISISGPPVAAPYPISINQWKEI